MNIAVLGTFNAKAFPVFMALLRAVAISALAVFPWAIGSAYADVVTVSFIATIGAGNSIDTGDVFQEGVGASLAGQTLTGTATVDTSALHQAGSQYGDFGAGAISVNFTLNDVTESVVSVGTLGFLGNTSGGVFSYAADYLCIGAATPDGMVQESLGVLFGSSGELVKGGVTFMTPIEHLDATITDIDIPEPSSLMLVSTGLAALRCRLRRRR